MTYSEYKESYKKAAETYRKKTVDTIAVYVRKGQKAELKSLADDRDLSLNGLMNKLVEYALQHPEILD